MDVSRRYTCLPCTRQCPNEAPQLVRICGLGLTMTLRLGSRATLISTPSRVAGLLRRPLQTRRPLSLSSVEGPKYPPLEYRTLPVYFRDEILAKHAERPALVCRQERPRAHGGPPSHNMGVDTHLAWDFQEFDRHIHALARGLVSLGVKRGDRVAVVMGNNRCAFRWHFRLVVMIILGVIWILVGDSAVRMRCYNGRARAWVRFW